MKTATYEGKLYLLCRQFPNGTTELVDPATCLTTLVQSEAVVPAGESPHKFITPLLAPFSKRPREFIIKLQAERLAAMKAKVNRKRTTKGADTDSSEAAPRKAKSAKVSGHDAAIAKLRAIALAAMANKGDNNV